MKKIISNKLDREKGITLIALIITIIILIILATITIGVLVSDNGIYKQSMDSKVETEIAKEKEIIELSKMSAISDDKDNKLVEDTLREALENQVGDKKKVTLEANENTFIVTFKDSRRKYLIDNVGEIKEYENVDHLHVGEYVNYTIDNVTEPYKLKVLNSEGEGEVVSQTAQSISQYKNFKWQIFNIDKNTGNIDLIADKMTTQYIHVKSCYGYNNAVRVLNDICEKQYSNTALGIKARSICLDDIENKFSEQGKSKAASKRNYIKKLEGGYSYFPAICVYENGYGIDTEDLKTNGLNVSDRGDGLEIDPNLYLRANSFLKVRNTFIGGEGIREDYVDDGSFDLLFKYTGDSQIYWLASRFVSVGETDTRCWYGI